MTMDPDDPRLTAYVLGELDDADRDAVREALEAHDPLRRELDVIDLSAGRLASAVDGAKPLRLTEAQRLNVLRAARTATSRAARSLVVAIPGRRLSLGGWPLAFASLTASVLLLFLIRVPGITAWMYAIQYPNPSSGLQRTAGYSGAERSLGELLFGSVLGRKLPPEGSEQDPSAEAMALGLPPSVAQSVARDRESALAPAQPAVRGLRIVPTPSAPRSARAQPELHADASKWPDDLATALASGDPYLPSREELENGAYAGIYSSDRLTAATVSPAQMTERAFDRQLVFRSAMRMQVHSARVTVDRARVWVEERGGFLESSSVVDGPDGGRGSAVLRVPRETFEATRQFLRGLASAVLADESTREDLTGTYADMAAQLANLETAEAEVRKLLESLQARGGSLDDVVKLHDELVRRRGEIDALRARLEAHADQAALSTITLTLEPVPPTPSPTATPIPPTSWSPRPAIDRATNDLARVAQGLTEAGLYFGIVFLPPLAVLGGALWLALRGLGMNGRRSDRTDVEVS